MENDPPADTLSLAEVFAGASSRSPLLQWMIDHHEEIRRLKASAPSRWAPLVAHLSKNGFCAEDGKAYSPVQLASAWRNACLAVEREKRKQVRTPKVAPVLPGRLPAGRVLSRRSAEPDEPRLLSDEEVQAKLRRVQEDLERASVKFPRPSY